MVPNSSRAMEQDLDDNEEDDEIPPFFHKPTPAPAAPPPLTFTPSAGPKRSFLLSVPELDFAHEAVLGLESSGANVAATTARPKSYDHTVAQSADRFNACIPCRQRKIRCTPTDTMLEPNSGTCGTCARRGKYCQWPSNASQTRSPLIKRLATATASALVDGTTMEWAPQSLSTFATGSKSRLRRASRGGSAAHATGPAKLRKRAHTHDGRRGVDSETTTTATTIRAPGPIRSSSYITSKSDAALLDVDADSELEVTPESEQLLQHHFAPSSGPPKLPHNFARTISLPSAQSLLTIALASGDALIPSVASSATSTSFATPSHSPNDPYSCSPSSSDQHDENVSDPDALTTATTVAPCQLHGNASYAFESAFTYTHPTPPPMSRSSTVSSVDSLEAGTSSPIVFAQRPTFNVAMFAMLQSEYDASKYATIPSVTAATATTASVPDTLLDWTGTDFIKSSSIF